MAVQHQNLHRRQPPRIFTGTAVKLNNDDQTSQECTAEIAELVGLRTGEKVAEFIEPSDTVLECACGTGAISVSIAPKCRRLIATDFAADMLRQAEKKCRKFENVIFRKADITHLKCKDGRFDKVVAGNVIHLLPNPELALHELERVVKPCGRIIIPTYINMSKETGTAAVKFITLLGADFKRQFDLESYKQFFADMGYANVEYHVVDGRMPCAIAVITKKRTK